MTLSEKQRALAADLNLIHDPHERLSVVMAHGRLAGLPAESKTGENLVPGCVSRVWLTGTCRDGLWHFQCDADSPMVKGLVAVLCELYSGSPAAEILAVEPEFWHRCGFERLLSPTRLNGLQSVRRRICQLAAGPEALPLSASSNANAGDGNDS